MIESISDCRERSVTSKSFDRLFNWRQWFSQRNDTHIENNGKDEVVSVWQMVSLFELNLFSLIVSIQLKFRFADHIDLFLMAFVFFISVLEACFFVSGEVLFGQISGIFAMESFADTCRHQQQNYTNTIKNNMTCPLGITLNPTNFNHLYR